MRHQGLVRRSFTSFLTLLLWATPITALAQPGEPAEPPAEPADGAATPDATEATDDGSAEATDETGADEEGRDPAAAGGSDTAAAQSLHQLGQALMRMGDLEEACPKLEQSLAAEVSPETALLLALCDDKQGKLASAWAGFRHAAVMLKAAGREAEARQAAERALDLEPQVPKLTIVPAQKVPGMEVWRDGVKFGGELFGVPVAINPGKHIVEIRAEGYEPWSTEVEVGAAGDRPVVAVPPLQPAEDAPVEPQAVPDSGRRWLFTAGVITAGAGVASIGVGTILGLVAARDIHTAESDELLCGSDRQCTDEGYALVERADREALGSTIAIAAGSVAVVTGFVLVVIDPHVAGEEGDAPPGAEARVTPWIGPTFQGIGVSGRF